MNNSITLIRLLRDQIRMKNYPRQRHLEGHLIITNVKSRQDYLHHLLTRLRARRKEPQKVALLRR